MGASDEDDKEEVTNGEEHDGAEEKRGREGPVATSWHGMLCCKRSARPRPEPSKGKASEHTRTRQTLTASPE
jgi:hypothetical protein